MFELMRVATIASLACTASSGWGQSFVNGSLDGPTNTHSLIPAGWSNLAQGTSDTVSAAGHPFAGFAGIGPVGFADSSDGGTFVWSGDFNGFSPGQPEGIRQSVSGLTVGELYRVSFEYTNLGLYNTAGQIATNAFGVGQNYSSNGRWLVLADGAQIGATGEAAFSPVGGQQVWQNFFVDFTAASSTIEFAFAADWTSGVGTHVGMGIDGIALTLVPAPGALGLLGAAVLIGARRRR